MSHLRLAERNNVSCFSLTESLCHVKLWRWRRRSESIERKWLLTSPQVIATWWTSVAYVPGALPPSKKQNNKHFVSSHRFSCQKRFIFYGQSSFFVAFGRETYQITVLLRNSISSKTQIVAYLIVEPVPSIFIPAPQFCFGKSIDHRCKKISTRFFFVKSFAVSVNCLPFHFLHASEPSFMS